ncbi:MAG: YciI family protein [Spirochaetales bacterium]|nr:YciI family protein [Spirochaetales bacterium]
MQYMLLIYDNESVDAKVQEAEFPEWMEYTRRLREAGVMLSGDALQPTGTATTVRGKVGAKHELTDGPYVETKEALGGYYLIEATDLDRASDWASQMPHIKRGGIVEVRPIMALDQ